MTEGQIEAAVCVATFMQQAANIQQYNPRWEKRLEEVAETVISIVDPATNRDCLKQRIIEAVKDRLIPGYTRAKEPAQNLSEAA